MKGLGSSGPDGDFSKEHIRHREGNGRMGSRTFTVRIKKDSDSGWYAARCVELPEAISQGKTEKEALKHIKEAIDLVLQEYQGQAKNEGGKLVELVV